MIPFRTGIGVDVHQLAEGAEMHCAGLYFPDEPRGLAGHSDGDVACHAVCDALLGALALGDIGRHFPPGDPRWAGVDSRELLRAVVAMLHERGWRVGNVDAVVICERPKLLPHIDDMRERLAADLEVAADAVGVKATTSEKLGFTGRQEGVAAHAVALLMREAA